MYSLIVIGTVFVGGLLKGSAPQMDMLSNCSPLPVGASAQKSVLQKRKAGRVRVEKLNATPLILAATQGNERQVQEILSSIMVANKQSDIDWVDDQELAAIDYACMKNRPRIVKMLLDAGSFMPQRRIFDSIIRNGYIDCIKILMEYPSGLEVLLYKLRSYSLKTAKQFWKNFRAAECIVNERNRLAATAGSKK